MFNYVLYRVGRFIAVHVPLKLAYAIGVLVSDIHYLFARADRIAVLNNLRIIFPSKPDRELRGIRIRLFRNFAKYLVDFFRFSLLDRAYVERYVKLRNLHHFDAAAAMGKGVIALTAHLGNWELGGVVMGITGYAPWAVALAHKNKKVDDFFNAQRNSKGVRVIPVGKAARMCFHLLHENKILALVGDRDFTDRGVAVGFFGRQAMFPEGPAALAVKTGAAIVPGFMIRNPDDTFTLVLEDPIVCEPTGDYHADVRFLIGRYKAIFENYIRAYPDQWYQFRSFQAA